MNFPHRGETREVLFYSDEVYYHSREQKSGRENCKIK